MTIYSKENRIIADKNYNKERNMLMLLIGVVTMLLLSLGYIFDYAGLLQQDEDIYPKYRQLMLYKRYKTQQQPISYVKKYDEY